MKLKHIETDKKATQKRIKELQGRITKNKKLLDSKWHKKNHSLLEESINEDQKELEELFDEVKS